MNFLTDQVKKFSGEKKEETSKPAEETAGKPASSGELMTSAKVVAESARAAARNETDKIDKGKTASAGADLLDAASKYGKFDDKSGVGQYIDKAENYLRQYESSHSSTTTTGGGGAAPAAKEGHGSGEPEKKEDEKDSGSGLGDYMKMAKGFMK